MSPTSARTIEQTLKSNASTDKAKNLARFFKTGKGEYGEGDKFMGIVVPDIRRVAKEYYQQVTLGTIHKLIKSPYHEVRLCALIMLVYQYQKAQSLEPRAEIYDFYLSHTTYINNWDLVDLSAPNIVGEYLLQNSNDKVLSQRLIRLWRKNSKLKTTSSEASSTTRFSALGTWHVDLDPILIHLSKSASLWERRIAVLATFSFIRVGRYQETFAIAEKLLHDEHDLIHKAVGWMLREVGKRVGKAMLCRFLDKHAGTMPRTMLRYAIEHLSDRERKGYLSIKNI